MSGHRSRCFLRHPFGRYAELAMATDNVGDMIEHCREQHDVARSLVLRQQTHGKPASKAATERSRNAPRLTHSIGTGGAGAMSTSIRRPPPGVEAEPNQPRLGRRTHAVDYRPDLDEIGELGLGKHTMILRAIEDKRFLPVGSHEVVAESQLIAGTNRDLGEAAAAGAQGRFLRSAQSVGLPPSALPTDELDRFAEPQGDRTGLDMGSRQLR